MSTVAAKFQKIYTLNNETKSNRFYWLNLIDWRNEKKKKKQNVINALTVMRTAFLKSARQASFVEKVVVTAREGLAFRLTLRKSFLGKVVVLIRHHLVGNLAGMGQ
jgi:chemotaxis methyl-accepting protein methylase